MVDASKNVSEKKQVSISISLPADLCQRIDVLAEKDERPRSFWIRMAFRVKLEREEGKNRSLF